MYFVLRKFDLTTPNYDDYYKVFRQKKSRFALDIYFVQLLSAPFALTTLKSIALWLIDH